jgi:hypothetical protein
MNSNEDRNKTAGLCRELLQQAMDDHDKNPTTLAKACGWKNPNKIYNFLNGESQSLDTETYEQIVKAMPGTTIEGLRGQKPKKALSSVILTTVCQSGKFRESPFLGAGLQEEVPLPVDETMRAASPYAARVRHPGAESIYADGSLLVCVPIDKFDGAVGKGRRVVVERKAGKRIEVTVREIQEDGDGKFWLSHRSTHPGLSNAVKLPKRALAGEAWQTNGDKLEIHSVVIGAYIPE